MTIIGDFAGIIAFVLFFRLIYLFFKSRKNKDWSSFKKEGIIFVVCFILAGLFADTSSSDTSADSEESSKTEQVSKSKKASDSSKLSKASKKSVSSKQSSKANKKATSSKQSSVNEDIAKTLSEEKNYAQQGKSDFEFANYINSIKYTGNADITVYVTDDFANLPNSTKTDYLNEVQSMVQMPLLDHNKITNDDCREGVFITVNLGSNSIGHSKVTAHKEYKFND